MKLTLKKKEIAPLLLLSMIVISCSSVPKSVVAATGTSIGVDVSQNPANQTPQMKLGYNRAETAVVSENEYDGDVANVLMELRYAGAGATNQGIYQRLAVGKTAVGQPGASLMFMKDADGTVPDAEALQGVSDAVDEFDESNFSED